MRVSLLFTFVISLSGCLNVGASVGLTPGYIPVGGTDLGLESEVGVVDTSMPILNPRASLAVLLGDVDVDDDTRQALGLPVNGEEDAFTALFIEHIPESFSDVRIGEREPGVRGFDASELGMSAARPADGTRIAFEDFEADYVLLIPTLEAQRYGFGGRSLVSGHQDILSRLNAEITVWDNTRGSVIALGDIEAGTLRDDLPRLFEAFVLEIDRETPIGAR
ncbi:MAG: hypothetical protein CMM84_12190 [Rhodothermaceae bacterium]|nr:hypothetical protein [Rhodothermaceae bacterium]MBC11541.1 hypothetical protein [Rhodothermaceae bacterium]